MAVRDVQQPALVLTTRRRLVATAGLLLGIFLAALEATVVSTAMPTVVASLGGLNHYSWVFSAYLLTSTATVPLWGRLSDLYGRRRLYLAAIVLFLVGSMLAGVSQSMPQLIVFRALQGLGAGGLIPLALTIIGEMYTLTERTRMQGVFSSVWGISSIVGPLVGGFITDSISWRWVFYLNLPIGLIAGVIIHRTLPEHAGHRQATVDWQGGLLLFLSTTLLLIALTEASLVWALGTLLSMGAFAYVERRAGDPILPFALFRNRTVAVAAAIGFLAGMVLFGTLAFIPLLVQVTTGGSATSAGQILTPLYLTWVLASIVAARLLLRIGARVAAIAGSTALLVASMALPWLAVGSSRAVVFADIALMGAGLGFALLSLLLAVQHSVARTELGIATSFNMFARTIGGAAGVGIMGAILAAGMGGSLQMSSTVDVTSLSALSPELRQRLIVSVQRAFASGAVAAAFALVAAFWMPPLSGDISSSAAAEMISGDIAPLGSERERMAVDN